MGLLVLVSVCIQNLILISTQWILLLLSKVNNLFLVGILVLLLLAWLYSSLHVDSYSF